MKTGRLPDCIFNNMRNPKIWKLSILNFCLILAVTFMLPGSARASGINFDDTVEKGEVVDRSLVLSGPVVVMDGTIQGDLVAIGDEVKINGKVDGSLVVIGKQVLLNGTVSGSAYIGAVTLVVGPQASVERDVSFIGGRLDTQEASSIARDLNILSLEAALAGRSGRDVKALVGPLKLLQIISDFLKSQGWLPQTPQSGLWLPRIAYTKQSVLAMAFSLPSIQNLGLVTSAPAGGPARNPDLSFSAPQQSAIDVPRLKAWAVPFLRNLVALFILGLLGVWLVPARVSRARDQAQARPWRALLNGLLVFVLGWFCAILGLGLILALAIFLYWVSLPNLGFWTGALGLLGLGAAVSIFWLSITYFSKIIIAILVGTLLFRRFIPKYAHNRILPLLTGVFLYALLASIPYLGWLVTVIVTFFGLGALWMSLSPRRLPEDHPSTQPQPAGDDLEMSVLAEG
jgi:hypothetical protein